MPRTFDTENPSARALYLVVFLNAQSCEFYPSLYASRAAAEAAYEDLLRRFDVKPCYGGLADDWGEAPHLYRIAAKGRVGEEIHLRAA
jgi:hypothetical protein